jgi:hypothetical protein
MFISTDPGAGPVLRGMFDAVLVDEYQDVNAVQASRPAHPLPAPRRPGRLR